jgi:dCMP deaminase
VSEQASWSDIWLQVSKTISTRSRCSRAQIGAVIVNSDQRIISTGYNGAAATYPTQGDCTQWCERAQGLTGLGSGYEGCPSIHAEANALLYVDRSAVHGATMYITAPPCMNCAKLISNSGVTSIVCLIGEQDMHRNPQSVLDYLAVCGISVTQVPR